MHSLYTLHLISTVLWQDELALFPSGWHSELWQVVRSVTALAHSLLMQIAHPSQQYSLLGW